MGTCVLSLEDLVVAVYCALDDALNDAGQGAVNGKLVKRRGPKPEVDDREILCLAVLQEILGFESDNEFHLWINNDRTMRSLFPRVLSRQNFAERRLVLMPMAQKLCAAFCNLVGDGTPPFSSSTVIPLTSAVRLAPGRAMNG
jgi:hypothetical protein